MDQDSRPTAPDWEECLEMLRQLPGMAVPERLGAIERLLRNPSPTIRQRALRMGAALLPNDRLEAWLREEADDVLRNAGLEILKLKGGVAFDMAVSLAQDSDPDVVLQAILLLDHIGDPRAYQALPPLLQNSDTNVVQAALTTMGHLGDSRTVPDLLPFLMADPWLQMAAVQALGDLRSPQAVVPLKALLPDLFLGPLAAEALARIGGRRVFRLLSDHWLAYRADLDAERFVGLLAHVAQGLHPCPQASTELISSLEEIAGEGSSHARQSAAECLLALGPSPADRKALDVLASASALGSDIPHCLKDRDDLIPTLILADDPLRDWGFQAVVRSPRVASTELLIQALSSCDPTAISIRNAAKAASKVKEPGIARALLRLFLALPHECKADLAPALTAHRREVLYLLSDGVVVDPEEVLLVGVLAGDSISRIVSGIRSLPEAGRLRVITQVSDKAAILRRLPWAEWIEADPARYVPLLSDSASRSQWHEALEMLRPFLQDSPIPEVVRAAGSLRDRESVPLLANLLADPQSILRACALDSLGQIGGPQARATLQRAVRELEQREARLAYLALGRCATEEDAPLFRQVASDPDWMVRMSSTDALGRFPSPDNLAVLMGLAADPVAAVAQKAQTFLDS